MNYKIKYLPYYILKRIVLHFDDKPKAWPIVTKILIFMLKIPPNLRLSKRFDIKKYIQNEIARDNKDYADMTCHIFGNGMSVMSTYGKVDSRDFVIKINSGAIIPTHTNIWITEMPHKNELSSERLKENIIFTNILLRQVTSQTNCTSTAIIKNVWHNNLRPERYLSKDSEYEILSDYLIRPEPKSEGFLREIIKHLIIDQSSTIGQWHSSILTALLLAHKLGFKRIIIHGLDTAGPHFFHHAFYNLSTKAEMRELIEFLRRESPVRESSDNYTPGLRASKVLNYYIDILSSYKVEVSCAS